MKNLIISVVVFGFGCLTTSSFADGKKGDADSYISGMTAGCARKGAPVKFDVNWGKESQFEGVGPTFSKLETVFRNACSSFHELLTSKKINKIHLLHDASKTEEGAYEMEMKSGALNFTANLAKFRNSSATPRVADKMEELLKEKK